MAEHETFGGQTVAPTNPGLWLGPEVREAVGGTLLPSRLLPSVSYLPPSPPSFLSPTPSRYFSLSLSPCLQLNLGKTTTDLASDVYSFGMVIWHLFSRKLPFDGKRMTEPQIMTLTGTKKQRPAMPPYPECPQFWVTLIDKCWQDQTTVHNSIIAILLNG